MADFEKITKGMEDGAEAIAGNFDEVDTRTVDTGWKNLTLKTGFTAGNTTPQIRKIGKHVFLRGQVKSSKAIAGTATSICTLPYVPDSAYGFQCQQLSSMLTNSAIIYAQTTGSLDMIRMDENSYAVYLNAIDYFTN